MFHPRAAEIFNDRAGRLSTPQDQCYNKVEAFQATINEPLTARLVKTETIEEGLNQDSGLIVIDSAVSDDCDQSLTPGYFQTLQTDKTTMVPGFQGLSIRTNQKSWIVSIRVKKCKILKLMKICKKTLNLESEIEDIQSMYRRFLDRREARMSWSDISYLKANLSPNIETFTELFNFYRERPHTSHKLKTKIDRIAKRYFAGELGNRKIEFYCAKQFANDYLNVVNPNRVKTDRDEILKIFNAARNLAIQEGIVKPKQLPDLTLGENRNRAKKHSQNPPQLSSFVKILKSGLILGHHQMVLCLLIQEALTTRKVITTKLSFDRFNAELDNVETYAQESKGKNYCVQVLPDRISKLVKNYIENYLTSNKSNPSKSGFLFESPKIKGQARPNFDTHFDLARQHAFDNDTTRDNHILNFTQHRTRDLADKYMLAVGATEAQKEVAAGRVVGDLAHAYGDLSNEVVKDLKNLKFDKIAELEPDYLEVVNQLEALWAA